MTPGHRSTARVTARRCAMPVLLLLAAITAAPPSAYAQPHVLGIDGTRFTLDGEPFEFTGVSFFNAIYNPAFNRSRDERLAWIQTFQRYGINVLRVWAQWDNARGFVDACETCTLYFPDGRLREEHMARLEAIAADADRAGTVVLLALFARESWNEEIRLEDAAADRAVAAVTRRLMPYRNVVLQIWNEFDHRVLEHVQTIKQIDPQRIVTNSPGYAGVLGSGQENRALDYLSPHTTRHEGRPWEVAPREVALLLAKYGKPVVDDEPARTGTPKFGGPRDETSPFDRILNSYNVWRAGGYVVYHHDMFQTGYGSPAVPPTGVPDPEFSEFHRPVFEFLARRARYGPEFE
jgi:hypothetical protein